MKKPQPPRLPATSRALIALLVGVLHTPLLAHLVAPAASDHDAALPAGLPEPGDMSPRRVH